MKDASSRISEKVHRCTGGGAAWENIGGPVQEWQIGQNVRAMLRAFGRFSVIFNRSNTAKASCAELHYRSSLPRYKQDGFSLPEMAERLTGVPSPLSLAFLQRALSKLREQGFEELAAEQVWLDQRRAWLTQRREWQDERQSGLKQRRVWLEKAKHMPTG